MVKTNTAWKVSVFGDFLVRIFPLSDWIRRDTKYLSPYSARMRENMDQRNSKYGHFLRSERVPFLAALNAHKIGLKIGRDVFRNLSNIYDGSIFLNIVTNTLRKRCPYSELFWSAFSHIRTEYEETRSTRITPNTDTSHAVIVCTTKSRD